MGLSVTTRPTPSRWGVLTVLAALVVALSGLLATPRAAEAQTPATEIFARIAPAVPVVETPRGHGTGFLIDANHVMTDAHVVEDFDIVKVRFPDGATFGTAKVVVRDRMVDLAVIEIAGTRDFVPTIADAPTVVGSELYVLGYPGRTANSPQPVFSRGLLSQVSRWDAMGITYLRTDASGEPGISGGPVLDAAGNVVAIIQFGSPAGSYMVGASAAALKARALRHLAGEDVDGITRRAPFGPSATSFEARLGGPARPEASYFVTPTAAVAAQITLDASGLGAPVAASLYTGRGEWVAGSVLNAARKTATLSAELAAGQTYWLSVASDRAVRVGIRSTVAMTRFDDPDDSRMNTGRNIAMFDHANDTDCRPIALRAGQKITARAESVTADPTLYIASPGGAVLAGDSDTGDGIRGGDAEASTTAASDGDFVVCVSSEVPVTQASGYALTVTTTPVPVLGAEAGRFSLSSARLAAPRRSNPTVALLDGRVMTIGGMDANDRPLATAEILDPATNTVTVVPTRDIVARRDATAVLLKDGRVLVIGGATAEGVTNAASVFNPTDSTWTTVGPMSMPRLGAEAIVLDDGRVLIATGSDRFGPTTSAEIFDPITGRFSITGSMTVARSGLVGSKLLDGRVLFAGGVDAAEKTNATAEFYDPKSGRFTSTGGLNTARYNHNSTLLPNGRVLITGGTTPWEELTSAELYDPDAGVFRITGDMQFARQAHSALLLPNGRVLIASGAYSTGLKRDFIVEVGAAELYDNASGTFIPAGSMAVARAQFGAVLPGGGVVFMGGATEAGALDSIETYAPGSATPVGSGGFVAPPVFGGSTALAVFKGGTVDQLEATAQDAGATGVWVQDGGGTPRLLVVGGPGFVSSAFRAAFSRGVPASTSVTLTR